MSGFARKLRRQGTGRVLTSSVEPSDAPTSDALELARSVVAWHPDDAQLELAARTIDGARNQGLAPSVVALLAHVATCDSGGELGRCTHTDDELAEILPTWAEAEQHTGVFSPQSVGLLGKLVMLVAFVGALLLPSSAHAAGAAARTLGSHKIHRRKIRHRHRGGYDAGFHGVWPCFESSGAFGLFGRRSMSRRPSVTGYVVAQGNSRRRGRRSKSSWCGDAERFGSGVSRTAIRTSRSVAPTDRSNARHTRATDFHPSELGAARIVSPNSRARSPSSLR
jgi:hypothetical protein